jgi:hypothetical protein
MSARPSDERLGCTDCERIRDGRIAQPVNTLTSATLVVAGTVVALRARQRPERRLEQVSYGTLLALVGVGSIAFHGPQPPGAKVLHDWPIAGLLALTVATPIVRAVRGRTVLSGWSSRRGAALVATGAAAGLSWFGGRTDARTCDPDSWFQLHGCWHVLTALGFTQAATIRYGSTEAP